MPGGLWADGLFDGEAGRAVSFHAREDVTDDDVRGMVVAIQERVLRLLRRLGKLPAEDAPADDPVASEPTLLDELTGAAVQGRAALGKRRGCPDLRVGRGSLDEPFRGKPLCADVGGFSLHAAVVVPRGERLRLEKLCRYMARPPLAEKPLSLLPDGKVLYTLKRRWRDGSTHLVMEPLALLERPCALVPPPRRKLLTYHGVFAPTASARALVVPAAEEHDECRRHRAGAAKQAQDDGAAAEPQEKKAEPVKKKVPDAPRTLRVPRSRLWWAELMQRVFRVDVLTCPECRGRRRVLAGIFAVDVIRRILEHLGLPTEAPLAAPARPPPQRRLPW